MADDSRGRRVGRALSLTALSFALLSSSFAVHQNPVSVGVGSPSILSDQGSAGVGPLPSSLATDLPTTSAISPNIGRVLATVNLGDNTVLPGNAPVSTCDGAYDEATATPVNALFVTCEYSDSLVEFNLTTGAVEHAAQLRPTPAGVVFVSANDRVYVADSDGYVVAFDAKNLSEISAIYSGCSPVSLALDPESGDLYVTDYCSGNVTVISTTSDSVVDVVSGTPHGNPWGIAYDGFNHDVYVADSTADEVEVVATSTDAVVSKIALPAELFGLACDSVTGAIYVAVEGSQQLAEISGATQSVERVVNLTGDAATVYVNSTLNRVYVLQNNLTVMNGATLAIVGGAPQGPSGEDVVDSTGFVYVTDSATNTVAVYDEGNLSVGQRFFSDPVPTGLAWDPASEQVFVANQASGTLLSLDDKSFAVTASSLIGFGLSALGVDTSNGHLFVATESSRVDDVSPAGKVQGEIPVGRGPGELAYDPQNGQMYVTNTGGFGVSVINATEDQFLETIPSGPNPLGYGYSPFGIAYDPINESLDVASGACLCLGGGGYIEVVNASTNNDSSTWAGPTAQAALALDVENDTLYVTDAYDNLVWALNASTGALTGLLSVGTAPGALAMDSRNGCLYVANLDSDNVSVINPVTNRVIGSIGVGSGPDSVAFDPSDGDVYVANSESGSVSVIGEVSYNLTFIESGLAPGMNWSVTLAGVTLSSLETTITFSVPNGSFSFAIAAPGYLPLPGRGIVAVNGASVTDRIVFSRSTYSVVFVESGLPIGTFWSVTLGGSSSTTASSAVFFTEPNGSYAFNLSTRSGFSVTPSAGTISVNGSFQAREVNFTPILSPLSVSVTYTTLRGVFPCGATSRKFWALVQFNATPSGGNPPYSYLWSFGDSSIGSVLMDPEHNYTLGSATATVELTDNQGRHSFGHVTLNFAWNCPSEGERFSWPAWVLPVIAVLLAAGAVGTGLLLAIRQRGDQTR